VVQGIQTKAVAQTLRQNRGSEQAEEKTARKGRA